MSENITVWVENKNHWTYNNISGREHWRLFNTPNNWFQDQMNNKTIKNREGGVYVWWADHTYWFLGWDSPCHHTCLAPLRGNVVLIFYWKRQKWEEKKSSGSHVKIERLNEQLCMLHYIHLTCFSESAMWSVMFPYSSFLTSSDWKQQAAISLALSLRICFWTDVHQQCHMTV